MTMWCHHAELRPGFRTAVCDRLGLLHFHETGLRRKVQRAKQVVYAYEYLDPRWPLEQQLHVARQLYGAPIACGHRLNELLPYIERKSTLQAFAKYLGRLPRDVDEMNRYASDRGASPAALVRRDIALGILGQSSANLPDDSSRQHTSWDTLLYHEERSIAPDGGTEFIHRIDLSDAKDGTSSSSCLYSPSSHTHARYSTLLESIGDKYRQSLKPQGDSPTPSGAPPETAAR
jgi:hypothetical protein